MYYTHVLYTERNFSLAYWESHLISNTSPMEMERVFLPLYPLFGRIHYRLVNFSSYDFPG